MGKRWLPLESNPEVLNDFAAKLGMSVDKFKFCDVFGLDPVRRFAGTLRHPQGAAAADC